MRERYTCSICGTKNNVSHVIISDNNKFTIKPICIKCQKTMLEKNEVILWEHDLKNIENMVAEQLLENKFTNIKFKDAAKKLLLDLMKKYSVRCVFEVCTLLSSEFNPHLISALCKKKFIS